MVYPYVLVLWRSKVGAGPYAKIPNSPPPLFHTQGSSGTLTAMGPRVLHALHTISLRHRTELICNVDGDLRSSQQRHKVYVLCGYSGTRGRYRDHRVTALVKCPALSIKRIKTEPRNIGLAVLLCYGGV